MNFSWILIFSIRKFFIRIDVVILIVNLIVCLSDDFLIEKSMMNWFSLIVIIFNLHLQNFDVNWTMISMIWIVMLLIIVMTIFATVFRDRFFMLIMKCCQSKIVFEKSWKKIKIVLFDVMKKSKISFFETWIKLELIISKRNWWSEMSFFKTINS